MMGSARFHSEFSFIHLISFSFASNPLKMRKIENQIENFSSHQLSSLVALFMKRLHQFKDSGICSLLLYLKCNGDNGDKNEIFEHIPIIQGMA